MVRYNELKKLIYAKIRSLHSSVNPGSENRKYTPGVYYPADAWKCPRQVFLRYKLNTPSDVHERAMGRIIMSHLLEKMFLEQLQKLGYKTHQRFSRMYKDILIKGEVDAVNRSEVIEIKTVTPTIFRRTPFIHDVVQLNIYMWLTERRTGTLIYVKSDNPAIFETYEYAYTPEYAVMGLENLRMVHRFLIKNELPPETDNKHLCKTCVFKNICKDYARLMEYIRGLGTSDQSH